MDRDNFLQVTDLPKPLEAVRKAWLEHEAEHLATEHVEVDAVDGGQIAVPVHDLPQPQDRFRRIGGGLGGSVLRGELSGAHWPLATRRWASAGIPIL